MNPTKGKAAWRIMACMHIIKQAKRKELSISFR